MWYRVELWEVLRNKYLAYDADYPAPRSHGQDIHYMFRNIHENIIVLEAFRR
ncbi:hypothetical protein D3C87_2137670 [compost metagenome]